MNENHLTNILLFPNEESSLRLHKVSCIGPIEKTSADTIYSGNRLEEFLANPVNVIDKDGFCPFLNGENHPVFLLERYSKEDTAFDLTDFKLEDKKLYLLCNLMCNEEKSVVIRLGGQNVITKVWWNQKLVFIGRLENIDTEVFLVNASQGKNCIFIELLGSPINALKTLFTFHISDFSISMNNNVLKSYYEKDLLQKVVLITNRRDIEDTVINFMIIPKDFINISPQTVIIKILDKNERLIKTLSVSYGELVQYDIHQIPYNKNDFLYIEVEYTAGNKHLHERFVFLLCNAPNHFYLLKKRFIQIKKTNENRQNYELVEQWIAYIELLLSGEIISKAFECNSINIYLNDVKIINSYISALEKGENTIDYFIRSYQMFFYKSKLDQTLIRYDIKLPLEYDTNKKYPLIIYIPNGVYENQSIYCLSNTTNKAVILAELCLRGMTFGSYIGEAAFFEGFNKLLTSLAVDVDKIYLMGACSAAYAAFSLAQCYPDLFAGLIVSNGEIDVSKAMNLSNIAIINICTSLSNKLKKVYYVPSEYLAQYGLYEAHLFDISQDSLSYLIYNNKYLLDWVLNHTRNNYPNVIYFHSDYSHNRCYWCEILEKKDNDKSCQIEGKLTGAEIQLKMFNVKKLHLICDNIHITKTLPVIIDPASGNYDIIADDDFITISQTPQDYPTKVLSTQNINCGRGILNIYMDTLKIVIPEDSLEDKSTIDNVIYNLSCPKSSGYAPDIYIKYPKVTSSNMIESDYKSSNLIIIGEAYHALPNSIVQNMPLHFTKESFTYKGFTKTGNYFIMFIMQNPLIKDYSIVFVYANDSSLYRNIFTRKIIIPTYLNNTHSELENEAILFDGHMYYYIKHMGDDIARIPNI